MSFDNTKTIQNVVADVIRDCSNAPKSVWTPDGRESIDQRETPMRPNVKSFCH